MTVSNTLQAAQPQGAAQQGAAKRLARIAGLLYLVLALVGPVALIVVPNSILVPGDAAATANNLRASETLFRIGIASAAVVFLTEVALTAVLYVLFAPVSKTLALVAAYARLAMTVVQGVNLLNYFLALLLLGGAGYLAAFEPAQVEALGLVFINAYGYVAHIWGAFFGLHLLALGYLVYKSGFFPRLLGILLLAGGVGYLASSFGNYLFPQYEALLTQVVTILSLPGELGFTLWLLVKGLDAEAWEGRAAEPARV